jgi:NitT/TauT family transport system ATP-binding protein
LRHTETEPGTLSFVSIQEVSFAFEPSHPIVDAVTWSIEKGQCHCLVGRSGCGKTTLLKLAAGLLSPKHGSVSINGQLVSSPSPWVGFVFQNPTLLEWLTVKDNVALPLTLNGAQNRTSTAKVEELLSLVGLEAFAERYPPELSGGQQSRVAIARALARDPAVLLMDEPFAALDAITREELQDDLLKLCASGDTTVLFVTHDIAEAVYLGDVVAVMKSGQISRKYDVTLAHPRQAQSRFDTQFNSLCRDVHREMASEL